MADRKANDAERAIAAMFKSALDTFALQLAGEKDVDRRDDFARTIATYVRDGITSVLAAASPADSACAASGRPDRAPLFNALRVAALAFASSLEPNQEG